MSKKKLPFLGPETPKPEVLCNIIGNKGCELCLGGQQVNLPLKGYTQAFAPFSADACHVGEQD